MSDNLNLIVSYIKSKGVDQYELFYETSDNFEIISERGNKDFVSQGNISGLGIRIAIGKKIGFASTLDSNNYKNCVDQAIKIAKLNNEDPKFVRFAYHKRKGKRGLGYNEKLLDFSLEDINSLIDNYNKSVFDINKDIKIVSAMYKKVVSDVTIINSEGINVLKKEADNVFFNDLMDGKDNIYGAVHSSKLPIKHSKAENDVNRLLSMRNKMQPQTGERSLLLHPEALADLMDQAFMFSINADNVQLGKSFFTNKLNQKVFDKKITIVDNATVKDLTGSRPYDDEGIVSRKNNLIVNGILKGFLYDTHAAYHENKLSTGNAVRGYSSAPSINVSNILMKKGNKSEEKIISSIDNGIYVKDLIGVHTMDSTTGEFSLGVAEGFIIEKGEIKYPVKDIMVGGNLYKLLADVESVGNKLMDTNRGYYLPLVLCCKVKVVGK